MKTLAKVQERTEQLLQNREDNVSVFHLASYIRGRLLVPTRPQHSLGTYNGVNQKNINAEEKATAHSCTSGSPHMASLQIDMHMTLFWLVWSRYAISSFFFHFVRKIRNGFVVCEFSTTSQKSQSRRNDDDMERELKRSRMTLFFCKFSCTSTRKFHLDSCLSP